MTVSESAPARERAHGDGKGGGQSSRRGEGHKGGRVRTARKLLGRDQPGKGLGRERGAPTEARELADHAFVSAALLRQLNHRPLAKRPVANAQRRVAMVRYLARQVDGEEADVDAERLRLDQLAFLPLKVAPDE